MENEKFSLEVLKQLREHNNSIKKQAEVTDLSLAEFEKMHSEVMNVRDELNGMRTEMLGIKDEVVQLNSEIDNKVFLSEGMVENLSDLIKSKSTYVAKQVYGHNLRWNELSRAIGKVRPKFWSLLKNHCGDARKITTIKYKDYDEAVRFAENLNDYDFYAYCGKYGVPSLW